MLFLNILLIILAIYFGISVLIFFLINSNFIPSRRSGDYKISIPVELKFFDNDDTAYWEGKQLKDGKNVILLHGFTRNSSSMNKRAEIYWQLGYNIYLIDNRGHGKSKFILFPSGYQLSRVVRKFIKEKRIKSPILHGASMGGIAAAYVAQKEPNLVKAIVCEALAYDFDNLYIEIMKFMKLPSKLFFWMNWVSKKIVWRQFDPIDASYNLLDIKNPLFVIHGANDKMFRPEIHFEKTRNLLKDNDNFTSWLVPGSKHTRMDNHEDYKVKLIEFLNELEY